MPERISRKRAGGKHVKVRCISLWQPWASAMALGLKSIETRPWLTFNEGTLGIHAAQKRSRENEGAFYELLRNKKIYAAFHRAGLICYDALPFGRVLCVVDQTDCVKVEMLTGLSATERLLGDYRPGRFAWIFENIRRLKQPHPVCGRQGFFFVRMKI